MVKVRLETRCGCSRESEVDHPTPFIEVPLITRLNVSQQRRPESTYTPGKRRKFAFVGRKGKVWVYKEVED